MNISHPLGNEVKTASFSCYTSEEIKKLSVKEINNPIIFDAVGIPNEGGLYDPALGPFTHSTLYESIFCRCGTCNLDIYRCPGHFGHIELPVPVYNPLFFVHTLALLRSICLNCHHFKLNSSQTIRYTAKLNLLKHGLLLESQMVDGIGINDFLSNDNDDDDDNESDMSSPATDKEYFNAIDQFVKICLKKGDKNKYKLTAIIAERKKIMAEFLSTCSKIKQCGHCSSRAASFKKEGNSKIFRKQLSIKHQNIRSRRKPSNSQTEENISEFEQEQQDVQYINNEVNAVSKIGNEFITPEALRDYFHKLFANESELCSMLYCAQGILLDVIGSRHKSQKAAGSNIFFIDIVAVPPTRFRPANIVNDKTMENPQNEHLTRILNARQEFLNYAAKMNKNKASEGQTAEAHQETINSLMKTWINLQDAVNGLIDNTKGNIPTAYGKQAAAGIKQILEKKEGLFRKHLMGKRVNYAARSVISPDPYVDTDEIGVPLRFAKKLTYPEPVTEYNLKDMTNAVINGPDIWPGATHVQHEDGTLINLASLPLESRIALSEQLVRENTFKSPFTQYNIKSQHVNKKVFRHLRNGDMLLLNRQPTLHKPSIMAHKARVLKGEMTIRMHYANCNSYNADFDGDEMNMHFPQNEIARAEAMIIGNTNQQYIGPTSGNPLRGLIQDHVVAGLWMTCKDTFFSKGDYQQIVFAALRPDPCDARRVLTIPPAIYKPKSLWTGKQVVRIITTILMNLTRDRVPLNLKSKNKVSAEYWGWSASEEDTVIFMDGEHLTGVLDKSQFGATAFGLVHSCYELYSADIAGQLLSVLGRLFTAYVQRYGFSCRMDDLHLTPEGDEERRLLMEKNADIGKRTAFEYVGMSHVVDLPSVDKDFKNMMEEVLRDTEKHRGLDSVMKSKVNMLRTSIINTCIPRGLLKVFPYNNMQMMTISGAKGTNVNVSQISCCLGQQELEGRRVPVMVSGKTLPSFQPYDPSARAGGFIGDRFLTGIKPQEYFYHCMAGREGLIDTAVKTSRSGYLQRCLIKHLEGLRVHYDHTVRDIDGSVIQFHYGEDSLDIVKQKHLYKFQFNAENYKAIMQKYDVAKASSLFNMSEASLHAKKATKKPEMYDPVLSVYSPSKYLGSVSESFHNALEKYSKENPDKLLDKSLKENSLTGPAFIKLMHLKYLHSLVEPGEAVGLLASQGIGEPSTQMTLNTFHFAGFGAKNVTLGIPRLREIIMTASADIKTPMMTLPLRSHVSNEEAEKFCQEISKLSLAEVIEQMTVYEQITRRQVDSEKTIRQKMYTIRMEFYPKQEYEEEFNIVPKNIENAIELNFIRCLESFIKKEVDFGKPLKKSKELRNEPFDEDAPIQNAGGNESDDGDDDATNDKVRSRTRQHATYDAPDEDDLEVIRQTQRAFSDEIFEEDENNEQTRLDEVNEDDTSLLQKNNKVADELRDRHDRIIMNSNFVTDYRFDNEDGGWCEIELQFPPSIKKLIILGMAEAASKKSVIREISGISKCYPIANETGNDTSKTIATEGVNFYSIWKYDNIIDLNNIYSNDIVAILNTYGVEAARAAIIKEISVVFAAYGINVHHKHLTLVADYMTFEGKFKPFNRIGIDTSTSPLLKMSFESTCSFLTQATLHGDTDLLDSPSARLVLGKVVQGGTGSFEVRVPFESISKIS
ncbi:DNA-directed RNA polymerase I complex large subunit Nuc1 [Glomus cerebriforme]|uniref:DNA-directed RNA polymerase subunit n=1 Tax=Glomus cerebriforme TaxID=658196 RepID=A0A397SIW8_9GLOM|nr:DNA-directed RNA polymerase I complex large subunit Nuc1 [Glomus cerebriforme]